MSSQRPSQAQTTENSSSRGRPRLSLQMRAAIRFASDSHPVEQALHRSTSLHRLASCGSSYVELAVIDALDSEQALSFLRRQLRKPVVPCSIENSAHVRVRNLNHHMTERGERRCDSRVYDWPIQRKPRPKAKRYVFRSVNRNRVPTARVVFTAAISHKVELDHLSSHKCLPKPISAKRTMHQALRT